MCAQLGHRGLQEIGLGYKVSSPMHSDLLLPWKLHLLNVPPSSKTVLWARDANASVCEKGGHFSFKQQQVWRVEMGLVCSMIGSDVYLVYIIEDIIEYSVYSMKTSAN